MKKQLLSFLCLTTIFTVNSQTTIVDVTNPVTGATWMDRNLGATQAATSSTDAAAYGDYYQWGRGADGHQIATSNNTIVLSTTPTPGHGDFIVSPSTSDWMDPTTDDLWQGVNGVNNPCPTGYRIPTTVEFQEEIATWSSLDDIGAFNSVLKLPIPGVRTGATGNLDAIGQTGYYYSSYLPSSNQTSYLAFNFSVAGIYSSARANGMSCRCIKDATAGMNDQSSISFSIFPNPASSVLSVKSDFQIETIEIFDLNGTLIQTETSNEFSIENLAIGMYILAITTEKGVVSKRFVKN